MASKHLTFIIYDSILNSVFTSMVLLPLLKNLENDPELGITLISFEKYNIPNEKIVSLIPAHTRLHFILASKLRFLGIPSLMPAISQLRRLLKTLAYGPIIARGPLAGYMVIKASQGEEVIVQARGLAAEEYRYMKSYSTTSPLKQLLYKIVYKQLYKIEKTVYGSEVSIETVSPALKKYLVTTFNAKEEQITISQNDIPKKLSSSEIEKYRAVVREQLGIQRSSFVYCYSGSARPWQCVEETVSFFKEEYEKNKDAFLLILSAEKKHFENILKELPKENYLVISVKPKKLLSYLAACDAGMLFRKKDVINWVSRPSKMLEYQAAGLKIIHNDTVAWLTNTFKSPLFSKP